MASRLLSSSLDHGLSAARQTITCLFSEQVLRTPEAIAVVFDRDELTYRQLDERVNQLARHLHSMGVATGDCVGVFMDRSLDMVVAMLAILKAGAAYVPLDPGYPTERISLLIEDSGTQTVVTSERLRRALPAFASRIVSVDGAVARIADQSVDHVAGSATGDSLAYVIYTSGSTGRPKGVMVEHRNVLSFFSAMDGILGAEPGVWLSVTSISFDISVLELLWTLTRGFKVAVHGDEGTHTIANEIVRHRVTHLQLTPSLARMLTSDPFAVGALGSVKKLLIGGETMPASLVGRLRLPRECDLYNMYGPTETTVWSTAYRISETSDLGTSVPIGRPLANTKAYVLDTKLEICPEGVAGELFLGGEGVARGYWGRPDLTDERFLPDRFAGHGRMYRTGDQARFLRDGNLEFLGRTDFQVKLRGYRIELGEIEAVLEQLSTVSQAVVVARADRPGERRLVAYIVPSGTEVPPPAAFRAALESKLPEFMVPSHLVILDRLPLTPNGKVDRDALPPVFSPKAAINEPSPPPLEQNPRQQIERVIIKVWAAALGTDQVGPGENIFDLGATSLMMPEIQIELQRSLAREVPLLDLFQYPTVSSLAAHLAGESVRPLTTNRAQRRLAARQE